MTTHVLGKLFGVLSLALTVSACSPNPSSTPATPATLETTATAENTPEKIVALTSISADIVQTLADDTLVAIPGSSLLTADPRFEGLTIVSSGRTEPDLEKIVALQPDLVIGAAGFHDKTLERLTDLEVNVLSTEIDDWESLKNFTQVLATQLNVDPTPLVERYDACLAQASDSGPTAIVLASREPLLSPNKDSWAGNFLEKFNIQNLTADLQGQSEFQGYITLSAEKILAMNPEQLFFIDSGSGLEEEIAQLKTDPFWEQLSAVQSDQVYGFDYHGLINPGSVQSIEQVCAALS
ncbi:periplasmic binding protein [Leptolyngbya sp. Heron Island J]|uniref:ABC transporter substrate-binding protein n=1 Tax=Leptolyngbya sp. Heron Island J TaxID=1385935 RepID=UPI0003B9AD1D|nr:ABC transporter substrate-binding protein [Leptolyngbya sp. Heron Island J]ESA38592.1 periplasmic binding protein [Leptolyngbya sp. Heron Island J]